MNYEPISTFQNADQTKYRPGGDAQHVSSLLETLKACAIDHAEGGVYSEDHVSPYPTVTSEELKDAQTQLPSDALRAKLERAVNKWNAQQDAKYERQQDRAARKGGRTEGEVKVGRWFYPAVLEGGKVVKRNTKKDGSGEWVDYTEGE